ncbi:MAG: hypothetical protein HKP40_05335 [Litoreibacter sp.]|nr:hypothetical protein [Litoreibacter sp.]
MCWSLGASVAMVGLGAGATALVYRRGEPPAIWLTLGYFTLMEALQLSGYMVLDQCGTRANRSVTLLSYLHIVLQPLFLNAFALELVPPEVKRKARAWAYGVAALSGLVMVAQILPVEAYGTCRPGGPLCGASLCTVSGEWHIAWHIPYNGLVLPFEDWLGYHPGFPSYTLAVFLVPLLYGAWRFVLFHALAGPILAGFLTQDPNEMPAIWCLFSIGILLIGMSSFIRRQVSTTSWWGRPVQWQD